MSAALTRQERGAHLLDCRCPCCGSNNTRALSVIHESGTREFRYRRRGWSASRRGLGVFRSTTKGMSTTRLARNAAPTNTATSDFVWLLLAAFSLPFVLGIVWGLALTMAIFMIAAVTSGSRQQASAVAIATWASTFRCGRCGMTFEPSRRDDWLGPRGADR